MNSEAVFIFVAAQGCGGCISFKKNQWAATEAALRGINNLTVIPIEVSRVGAALPSSTPKDLSRFVSWYPTFILVTKESWHKNSSLEGVVFNGAQGKSKGAIVTMAPESQRKPLDTTNLVNWVKAEMATNPLFSKRVSFGPLVEKKAVSSSEPEIKSEYRPINLYCETSFLPFS